LFRLRTRRLYIQSNESDQIFDAHATGYPLHYYWTNVARFAEIMKMIARNYAISAAICLSPISAYASEYGLAFLPANSPRSINDNGQVADGHYLSHGGSAIPLQVPPGSDPTPFQINASGVIAGVIGTSEMGLFPVTWTNGALATLPVPDGWNGYARAINSQGVIVGSIADSENDGPLHASIWQGGSFNDLGTFDANGSQANGINDNGDIAGILFHADRIATSFLLRNGIVSEIPIIMTAMNGNGDLIGGYVGTDDQVHPCIWKNGAIIDLGGGLIDGAYPSYFGINDQNQAVGTADGAPFFPHAVLWQDGTVFDLNNLLDSNGDYPNGLILEEASAINNNGQIVGQSNYGGFVLTPISDGQPIVSVVPEPSALIIFVAPLLLARRRSGRNR
jgi:probable HAF family extracellular repeat protein